MKTLLITLIVTTSCFAVIGQDTYKSELARHSEKISEQPDNPNHYYNRALIYDRTNDFANAKRDFFQVLNLYRSDPNPDYTDIYANSCYQLADDLFYRKSNTDEAMKYISEGLNIKPDDKNLGILEAVVLTSTSENFESGIDKFESLEARHPNDDGLHLHYAQALEDFNPMAAAEQYEKALVDQPFNTEILLSLGTIYNNEAVRVAEEATNPEEVYALGEQALQYFDRAYQLNPDDAEIANILEQLADELHIQDRKPSSKVPF